MGNIPTLVGQVADRIETYQLSASIPTATEDPDTSLLLLSLQEYRFLDVRVIRRRLHDPNVPRDRLDAEDMMKVAYPTAITFRLRLDAPYSNYYRYNLEEVCRYVDRVFEMTRSQLICRRNETLARVPVLIRPLVAIVGEYLIDVGE